LVFQGILSALRLLNSGREQINLTKGPAMKTSQDAPVSGVYASECCNVQLMFAKGNTLWRCPECERLCNWDLMTTTVIPNRLESEERVAMRHPTWR
jgi:hypothetical protein